MIKTLWRRLLADRVTRAVAARVEPGLDRLVAARFKDESATLQEQIRAQVAVHERALAQVESKLAMYEQGLAQVESKMAIVQDSKPWKRNLYIPPIAMHAKRGGQFMAHSSCSAADFLHPDFPRHSASLGLDLTYHRKYWEWVFILHHGLRVGAIGPGKRALGFAVGSEPLP